MAQITTPEQAWQEYLRGKTTVDELLDEARQVLPPQEWAYEDAIRWYLFTRGGLSPDSADPAQVPLETIISLIGEYIRGQIAGEAVTIHKGERSAELRDRRDYIVARSPYSSDIPGSWEKAHEKLVEEANRRGLVLSGEGKSGSK